MYCSFLTGYCNTVFLPYRMLEDSGYMARVAFVMDKLAAENRFVRKKFRADD